MRPRARQRRSARKAAWCSSEARRDETRGPRGRLSLSRRRVRLRCQQTFSLAASYTAKPLRALRSPCGAWCLAPASHDNGQVLLVSLARRPRLSPPLVRLWRLAPRDRWAKPLPGGRDSVRPTARPSQGGRMAESWREFWRERVRRRIRCRRAGAAQAPGSGLRCACWSAKAASSMARAAHGGASRWGEGWAGHDGREW